jgi:pre-mRNA-processing factor 6
LERELGNKNEEKKILTDALERFPDFDKLWMMRGQWEEREKDYNSAREIYLKGV